ncbi:cytochrome P450 [Nocardia sp. N2S4-5]|uniref:cytochrome P450 n=1 Tax=Nocardia sp. N2S4-5 TaxID=3351565 RepID=UPI0037D30905
MDSPLFIEGQRFSMYTPEFAADPHPAYREMRRQHGSLVPVMLAPGVPATLVIGYRAALEILNDPAHFPADPRAWQQSVPENCPLLPMLEWRPNALRTDGREHDRYREANTTAIDSIDLNTMHTVVERIAIGLINTFCEEGYADLLDQYIYTLVRSTLDHMLGCTAEIGERVATGSAMMFDAQGDAEAGNRMLLEALQEHIAYKRAHPGNDITSRLIGHPAGLDDAEMVHQLVTLYAAGVEPGVHLIANTLRIMLTNDRLGGDLVGGSLSTRDALDEVLFTDPPLANYCVSYPRQPILINDVWLPANQPVVISMAAVGADPSVSGGDRTGNRSHLAWSAGPHACPARSVAYLIAQDAIDQLLDALPDIRLAVPVEELTWRPGPFHRALVSLPVAFPKSAPFNLV